MPTASALASCVRRIERVLNPAKDGIIDLTAFPERDERLTLGLDHFLFRARTASFVLACPDVGRLSRSLPHVFVVATENLRILGIDPVFALQRANALERQP